MRDDLSSQQRNPKPQKGRLAELLAGERYDDGGNMAHNKFGTIRSTKEHIISVLVCIMMSICQGE